MLLTLGIEKQHSDAQLAEWQDFSIAPATADRPPTTRLHIGFAAPSQEHVDAFWRAGTGAGFRDDGAPGPRPQYREDYYGAFLLDPDGNSAEAVHHGALRTGGVIEHLWIRVADVAQARRFCASIAASAGLRLRRDTPERAQVTGRSGSFSLVAGTPTQNVHMAFPAPRNEVVEDFHRVAMAAGWRDSGAPGERPEYHPGYYAAFVLDPDGNSIELVNHNRG